MTNLRDRPGNPRPGEELDLARLEPFLRSHFPDAAGPLEIAQFPSGHSNLTYLLRFGDRAMVWSPPPFGPNVKSANDMSREYRVLAKPPAAYPAAPEVLLYCEDVAILGS